MSTMDDEVVIEREPITHVEDDPGLASAEVGDAVLEDGDTSDPVDVSDPGLTYVAPIDPPTGVDERGDPTIAAGFGLDSDADPSDADHRASDGLGDDEMSERVRDRLAADSLGSEYVEQLDIDAAGGIVRVGGVVEDLDIQDHLLSLVSEMPGVREVEDRLRLL
jgi:hypothetical protein